MAQKGVIRSRLTLDTKEFYTRLDAALKKAQQTAAAMQKAFGKPLTMPTIPNPTTGTGRGGSRGDPALAAQREAARQGAAAVRDLELAYRKGRISLDDLITGAKRWEAQLERERSQLAENSKGYAAYTTSLRAVENVLDRAGRNGETRPVTAGINAISDALDRLQAAGALFLAGGFFARFFGGLDRLARGNTQATNALTLYRSELRDAGRDVDTEVARLDKLAARFKTNTEALSRFALILTRQGFTGEQQADLIEAVGASALNAGRDLNEAFGTAADAFARRDSALLNGLGIVTNFDDALQDFAKTQGVTADALDQASQNQAIYTGFIKETRQEVAALDVLLSGYAGSTASLENAQLSFGRTVGGVVTPVLTLLKDGLTLLLNLFNALPGPIKVVAVTAGVLTTALAALAVAYVSLRVLLLNQTVLGPVVATLLKNETILRSRLGAAIIVQARAYGILDKEQVRSAVTARNSAAASAAAAGGVSRLTAAMGLLNKVGRFVLINIFIAIIREASKYLGVFRPIVDSVSQALAGMKFSEAVKGLNQVIAGGKLFATIFGQAVLYTVTAVALTLEELGFQATRAYLLLERLAAQATGNAARVEELNQALVANRQAHEDSKNAILDNAAAYDKQLVSTYLAASGIETVGTEAERTAAALKVLTTEQKSTFAEISKGLGDFKINMNAGDLKRELISATAPLDDYLEQIKVLGKELGEDNPLIVGLQRSARDLKREASAQVLAQAVKEAQDSATQAQIGAMEEGSAKILAQRDADVKAEQEALEAQLRGFKGSADARAELEEASEVRIQAIRTRAKQALQQDAEQRLATQRQLTSDLAALQGQVNVASAEASGNTVAAINARSLEQARQIEAERQQMLTRVEGNDRASRERRAEINTLYDEKERLNTEQLTRDLEAEHKRRTDSLEAIAQRTAELQAQTRAAQQRDQGDELGAVRTELASRLQAIDDALADELEAEGLTQAEITALHQRANAERVAARQQAAQATKTAIQQERDAAKQALVESDQQLRQAQQGDVQGEIPRLRAQFAAEQAERRRADQERLDSFRGTEAERQRLIADAGLRELILTRQNQLQINRLEKQGRAEYAQAVRQYQEQVTQAYADAARSQIDAIEGQITKLKQLREEQVGIVSSGSQVLQYLRNQQELSGDNRFLADKSDARDVIEAQLRGLQNLYREAVKSNEPLEQRVALQEQIKTLIADAASAGEKVKLDPSFVRLMETDVSRTALEFPGKAAEAVENVRTLDEKIADMSQQLTTATTQLAELLGEAASDEGLKLKVTVDRSGLEQAQAALRETFGDQTANRVVANASAMGLNAGKAIIRTLRQGLQDRGGLLAEVDSLMRAVDDYFPHSNARKGALDDLTGSGMAIPRTIAQGLRRSTHELVAASSWMAARAKPAFAIPTSRPASYPAGGGGAGGTVNHWQISVDGRPSQPVGIMQLNAQALARDVQRELRLRDT